MGVWVLGGWEPLMFFCWVSGVGKWWRRRRDCGIVCWKPVMVRRVG